LSIARRRRPPRGFELPGAHHRRRIKELEAQIHHLDKAHHHSQLGDILFSAGQARQSPDLLSRGAGARPHGIDTRSHLGQCLLRKRKPQEARPLLEQVCVENPKHDYGHSDDGAGGDSGSVGRNRNGPSRVGAVLEDHSYARAAVQLAELYLQNQSATWPGELIEVVADDAHAPAFQRRRERGLGAKSESLKRKIG